MKRRQYLLLITLTVVAGLIGGAVSNWLFVARTAEAQETKKHEKVVIAEQFRLVDKEGNLRGAIGLSGKEAPKLWFYDEGGTPRIGMVLSDKGVPTLEFSDGVGKPRIGMNLSDKGVPTLGLYDEVGTPRLGMVLSDKGGPGLVLCDEGGTVMWSAP